MNFTDGVAEQIRHRYVRLDPDEQSIDAKKPIYLSTFGIWSKKSGYGRLRLASAGAPTPSRVERLVWLDKSVQRLAKAKEADVFQYSVEAFDDPPAVLVGASNLPTRRPS